MTDWSHYCIVVADEPIDSSLMASNVTLAKQRARFLFEDDQAEKVYIYGVTLVCVMERQGNEQATELSLAPAI